jgi:hypothetical protein
MLFFLYARMVACSPPCRVRTLSETILRDRLAWGVFVGGMAVISCLFYLAFVHRRSDACLAHYALFPIVLSIIVFDCVCRPRLHYAALVLYTIMSLWIVLRKHGPMAVPPFLFVLFFCGWCLGTAEILFLVLVALLV